MKNLESAKHFFKRKIESILLRQGYSILKTERIESVYRQLGRAYDICIFNASLPTEENGANKEEITGMVFSKDRPMQLQALLDSYFHFVTNPAPLYILYKTTSKEYASAYSQIFEVYKTKPVIFRKENHFRNDVSAIIKGMATPKVFFLVDDIIFIDDFDMAFIRQFDVKKYIFSLRLGKNIKYSYMIGKYIHSPSDIEEDESGSFISWRWYNAASYWGYPLSLDGHVFSRDEILLMVTISEFSSPNSLEVALQSFKYSFLQRYGAAFPISKIVNIPINRVQNEYQNKAEKHNDDKKLLRLWNQGYRYNVSNFCKIANLSAHEPIALDIIKER